MQAVDSDAGLEPGAQRAPGRRPANDRPEMPDVVDAVPVAVDEDAAEVFAFEMLVQPVVPRPSGIDAQREGPAEGSQHGGLE